MSRDEAVCQTACSIQFVSGEMTSYLTERALKWHFNEQGDQSSNKTLFNTVIMYSIDIIKGQKW